MYVWPAWRPPGGSWSSLVTAPSFAKAVPASAARARSVPTARIDMRRMRSSVRWLHGPCATCPYYNLRGERFPELYLRKDGASDGAASVRGVDRQEKEEAQKDEGRGPDERRAVAIEVSDHDPGDDRADRLREGPDSRAEAGHLGGALPRDEVDEQGNVERCPDPVGDPNEAHGDERLGHVLNLRSDERDQGEREHPDSEHLLLAVAIGGVARGDRAHDRSEQGG